MRVCSKRMIWKGRRFEVSNVGGDVDWSIPVGMTPGKLSSPAVKEEAQGAARKVNGGKVLQQRMKLGRFKGEVEGASKRVTVVAAVRRQTTRC